MTTNLSRREALFAGAAMAAGSLLPGSQARAAVPTKRGPRAIRIAHLTDMHVQPERAAGEGLAACLNHVQSLKDKPELILTGGDTVMDSFEAEDARAGLQWDLWKKVLKDNNSLPVESAIGNHDIWGWYKAKAKTTGAEPNYGKKRAMEMLGLVKPYHSFDRAGWHFVVLDSVQPDPPSGYKAYLDNEQFAWLEADLKATDPKTPVLVLSHVPIMAMCAIVSGNNVKNGDWVVSGGLMHMDALRIKDLFKKHPNVKVCLSGHIHLVDRVEYLGVTYLCNGAVCGGWWKGPHQECDPGYAVLDLFPDGTFTNEYIRYGWKARE